LPDGVLNLLFHRPQDAPKITETLIAHPAVRKINFTGSSHVGSVISSIAGKHLKPVLMELGGKASAIILKDADLANAAQQCAFGAFMNVSITYTCHMIWANFSNIPATGWSDLHVD
jgi:acyl-CoA reductase-like NAD-dependent aldehyde dehydrogenase